MKKRVVVYGVLLLLVMCMGLVSCGAVRENSAEPEGDMRDSDTASAEQISSQIPERLVEEIGETGRIDALIAVPDCVREKGFQKATAKRVDIDQDRVLAFLEEFYHPRKGIEYEQGIQYRGEDDMYLFFPKEPQGGASMTSSLRNYISMAYRDGLAEDCNRDLYPIDTTLEGFSLEDCDEMLGKFHQSIGLTGDVGVVHWALDHRTMEAEAVELHVDGPDTKPDYRWTAGDDSYYCAVSQLCNGMPILPSFYIVAYADILNAGGYNCLINRDRIISFSVENIYDIQYEEACEELLAFPEIVEKYKDYRSSLGQNYETTVTDIAMRVFAINQGKDEYELVPVWIFYGRWRDTEEDVTGAHAIFIHAVTGERL